jgi:hypothetical protein
MLPHNDVTLNLKFNAKPAADKHSLNPTVNSSKKNWKGWVGIVVPVIRLKVRSEKEETCAE